MTHTEEQIRELALKMMQDIGVDYFIENKISITFEENIKPYWGEIIPKGWLISFEIPAHRYPTQLDNILIFFNDETGKVVNYVESDGRTVPYTLKQDEEGKYYRYPLYDFISAVE